MRAVSIADSSPIPVAALKLYLLRVSTLVPKGAGRLELGWKQAPRGTVAGSKPDDSTPLFAEMVEPGTVVEGTWRENAFLAQPEIARMLRWREPVNGARLFGAANDYAERLVAIHKQYAEWTGLATLQQGLEVIGQWIAHLRSTGAGCVLSLGWGSGLLAKTGWLETDDQAYRQVLKQIPLYARAIESGLPFPKTRRVVFLENQPAALPGWVVLEVG